LSGWWRSVWNLGRQGGMAADEQATVSHLRVLLDRHGATLLALAAARIRYPLAGRSLTVRPADVHPELRAPGASFVTLHRSGELRGCVGTHTAWRPLVTDVIENAAVAAFREPRFPPLETAELEGLDLSVSLLSAPEPVPFSSEADLLQRLRVGVDGVILSAGAQRGLFLPEMWEQLRTPAEFMSWLKRKAGLPETYWSPSIIIQRFETLSVKVDDIAEMPDWEDVGADKAV
jgi:AmmeMemoRadiSam system protein A